MSDVYIRPALESDLPALTKIYNEAVTATTATLDLKPWTVEARRDWFRAHNKRNYPLLVAMAGEEAAGYASLSPLFAMEAYAASVELSVYVDKEYRGRGIGGRLMEAVLTLARQDERTHMVVSKITADNAASIRLHEKYGFRKTGTLKEIAWKFGRRLDVELYQLSVEA